MKTGKANPRRIDEKRLWQRYSVGWLLCLIISLTTLMPLRAQVNTVRINEFMALNQTTLVDEDGDDSDWIEIFNPTANSVDLQNWSLTDDKNEPAKWQFPQVTIEANDYLLLFASGKDRNVVGKELHTNFKLSGNGEYLALIQPDGTAATEFDPAFPAQETDISCGYFDQDYVYLIEPTPGAANKYPQHTLLPPPVFSQKHGFYDEPFSVEITTELQNAQIFYSTDGREPGEEGGTAYSAPIQITTTTVLRAMVVKSGQMTSKITTQTYLFPDDVIHQPNNPAGYPAEWGPYTAMNGTAIADYEMDPEITEDPAYAGQMRAALMSIPTLSIVTDKDNLFSHSLDPKTGGIYIYTGPPEANEEPGLGYGWERPASVELFDATGTAEFQVDCGLRLQGGHSRRPEKSPKHSFRLCFRSKYGPPRLEYPLFGADAATSFNTLTLRGGFCNAWHHHAADQRARAQYLRDTWAKDTQLEMGHPAGHGNFMHLYLNGIYWGLYNPTERMDSDFAASYPDGDPEDFDLIKDYTDVVDGNIDAWHRMMDLADAGLANNEAYQRIQGNNPDGTPNSDYEPLVDVVNLIDYMIINFYGGNTDWDHHNWAAARNRVNPGKGFKFMSWDAEHVLENLNDNFLDENNNDCPSDLFQRLRQNTEFRRLFADRVQLHCFNGGALTPESVKARWMKRAAEIDLAVIAESARWGDYRRDVHQNQPQGPFDLYTKNDYWLVEQRRLLNEYFPNRTNTFINQLRQAGLFPRTDAPVFLLNGKPIGQTLISPEDELGMMSAGGTIYYTTDGTDPLLSEAARQGEQVVIFPESADKRVLVPHAAVDNSWRSNLNFDDSGWKLCTGKPGGIGYEKRSGYENLISLDVGADMHDDGGNPNPSCFVRIRFNMSKADLERFKSLSLGVRYDDGYIFYLNGVKVAEANAPANPAWNSSAVNQNESTALEPVDISQSMSELWEGQNLLAVHAMNVSTSSSDFLISFQLNAGEEGGGDTSPGAKVYSEPFALTESTCIKARVLSGNEWSALNQTGLIIPSKINDLKLTEIHYHPQDRDNTGDRYYEFVELKNTGSTTLDLSNACFCRGIAYTFPVGIQLKPQGFIVLASNRLRFLQRYGFVPFDEYAGNLDNNGENLALIDAAGDTVLALRYNDRAPWPTAADGSGYSMVPKETNPTGNPADPVYWRSSFGIDGSPGVDDLPGTGGFHSANGIPDQFKLNQNFPNPFNNTTRIFYHLPCDARVKLTVCDILGRMVRSYEYENQAAGSYQIAWNGVDESNQTVASGIYFYRIQVETPVQKYIQSKKMMLLK